MQNWEICSAISRAMRVEIDAASEVRGALAGSLRRGKYREARGFSEGLFRAERIVREIGERLEKEDRARREDDQRMYDIAQQAALAVLKAGPSSKEERSDDRP